MLPPRQVIIRPRDGRPGKDADPAVLREAVLREVREAVAALPGTTLPWVAVFIRDDYSDLARRVLAGPVDGPPQIVMDVTRDAHDRIETVHIARAGDA